MDMHMETTLQKLSSGVYSIDQGMVRSFLIVGQQRALLFDTGAAPCDLPEIIKSVTDLPLVVLHSHTDGDHTANDGFFTDIYLHPADMPQLQKTRPELKAHLHPITEASSFDLGGRLLQVIEAPGHTPGSICLLDRQNRILFSGDTVSYGPVFLFGENRDVPEYRKTLEKLMNLGGFDTVYPCHNTCPVSLTVIQSLMEAVDGAMDGSLEPVENDMPMPPGPEKPECYLVGKCGILYAK